MSRRRFLGLVGSTAVLAAMDPLRSASVWAAPLDANHLITRVERPLNAETPVEALESWLTPNDRFFIRSHFGPPPAEAVDVNVWRLRVGGEVERPLTLTLDDLRRFDAVELTAVLQCSGNGRAFYRPRVPGAQWERSAVGNARWTGVRLTDVLARAGVRNGAAHVELLGADRPVVPSVPLFRRSIPLEKAVHPDTLLAYAMNGEPVPLLHGGPLRVIAPGWMGEAWVKWVTDITVQEHESTGYYMDTAYRFPRVAANPDADVSPRDMEPVTAMVVKSLITQPRDGTLASGREVTVRGVAWTGEGRMAHVEVTMDQGQRWQRATLTGQDVRYACRMWQAVCVPERDGTVEIWSRATDDGGATQPLRSPWNPGGYLWNGVDRVRVEVRRERNPK